MVYKVVIPLVVLIFLGLCLSGEKVDRSRSLLNDSSRETAVTNETAVTTTERVTSTTAYLIKGAADGRGKNQSNLKNSTEKKFERKSILIKDNATNAAYQQIWVLETGEPEIMTYGSYQYLFLPNVLDVQMNPRLGELMLPRELTTIVYPLRTVITNYSILSLEDPVDLNIPNLAIWYNEPISRLDYDGECLRHDSSVRLNYQFAYAEDRMLVGLSFVPVEVIDCEKGIFRVYRRIKYGVTYVTYSPVLLTLTGLSSSDSGDGEKIATVEVQSIVDQPESGVLFLDSKDGTRLFEKEISSDGGQTSFYSISFAVPEKEGRYTYVLGYMQDKVKKTEVSFTVTSRPLEIKIKTPSRMYIGQDLSAFIRIENGRNKEFFIICNIYALDIFTNEGFPLRREKITLSPSSIVNYSYSLGKLKPGSYTVTTKVSSQIDPEAKYISNTLRVEDFGPECKDQGTLNILQAVNTKSEYKAYCTDSKIQLLINLTNTGSSEERIEVEYLNGLIQQNRLAVSVGTPEEEFYRTSTGKFSVAMQVHAQSNKVVVFDLTL